VGFIDYLDNYQLFMESPTKWSEYNITFRPGTLRSYSGKIKAVYVSTAILLKKIKQVDISTHWCSEVENSEIKREVKTNLVLSP
jgi:hypothetical protein